MNKKIIGILITIFIAGVFLRFYQLGNVPSGFHRDEAYLGYNAYSILKTGKDMNGNVLPLHIQSFLYSPAGYSYFSIPFISIFGLSAFSVRFASALFGSLTILTTYILVVLLFGKWEMRDRVALLSAFLLAVSPWHINLSRTATENTVVVFLISVGVILFLVWANNKKLPYLFLSYFAFLLSLLTYQAPRAFLPFFIPLLIYTSTKMNRHSKQFLLAVALFIITILVPLFFILTSSDLSLRIRTVSIFATDKQQLVQSEQIREDGVSNVPPKISRTFHNKVTGYSSQILQNYFKHFTYDFLFTDEGLPDRYRVPLTGLLYIVELPFLLFGIYELFRKYTKSGVFLLGWVLLVPIGSALTFDDIPNLQRILMVFPALSIVVAYGIISFGELFEKRKIIIRGIYGLVGIILVFGIVSYLHQYYTHVSKYRPWFRNDGYEKLVFKLNSYPSNYKKTIITNRESAPTIFFLFYSQFNAEQFQNETRDTTMHDFDRINFGRYEFSQEECPLRIGVKDGKTVFTGEKEVLYVNSGLCKIPPGVTLVDQIHRADGSLVFTLLKVE